MPGKSPFGSAFVLLAACGARSAPTPSAPANHAGPVADCTLTGEVVDGYNHEPARGASVIVTGAGLDRAVQITDEAGRFTFPHALGRTRVLVYFRDRSAEQAIHGCGDVRVQIAPPRFIDI